MRIPYLEIVISLTVLIRSTFEQCNYYNTQNTLLPLDYPYQQVDQTLSTDIVNGLKSWGYGVWTKYQPFAAISSVYLNTDSKKEGSTSTSGGIVPQTYKQYFINLEEKDRTKMVLIHYLEVDEKKLSIQHVIKFQSTTIYVTQYHPVDYLTYEGVWVFTAIYFNISLQKVIIGFYKSDEISPTYYQIACTPQLATKMRYTIGGSGTLYDAYTNEQYTLYSFTGRMSSILLITEQLTIEGMTNLMQTCKITSTCDVNTIQIIKGQYEFKSSTSLVYKLNKVIEGNRFTVSGWVMLDSLSDSNSQQFQLLRVSLSSSSNILMYGDRVLQIIYYQNNVASLNGIEIQTYNYAFPAQGMYTVGTSDKVQFYDSAYQSALTQWHYIQYEYGRSSIPNDNSKMIIYFPNIGEVSQTWGRNNKQFTGVSMQFTIGNELPTTYQVETRLYDVSFTYCYDVDQKSLMVCHYSCLTCYGPTSADCESCPNESNRRYSSILLTCNCINGYVNIEGNPKCSSVNDIYPAIAITQQTLQCTKLGYQRCDQVIECSFGYFKYNNQCIQCPIQGTMGYIYLGCADCILQSLEWGNNMSCTYDLIAHENESDKVYITTARQSKDINVYIPYKSDQGIITLSICEGCLSYTNDQVECKLGYYKYEQQTCKSCGAHCTCIDSICSACEDGYALDHTYNKCVACIGCVTCTLSDSVYYCLSCLSNQVLVDSTCVDCGYKCAKCNSSRCLYCLDQPTYYISSDAVNCRKCSIANCLYCFEFYVGDTTSVTLNYLFTAQTTNPSGAQIGCARCQPLYFQSKDTLSCLPAIVIVDTVVNTDPIIPKNEGGSSSSSGSSEPSMVSQCNTGIFTTVKNDVAKCLVGDSGVVKLECKDLDNCSQCIKNYYGTLSYCMLCAAGYYANLQTGSCSVCTGYCSVCIQQQTDYQDGWKWNIRGFYQYQYNTDGSTPFTSQAISTDTSDYEIKCSSCSTGYKLNDGKCIADCPAGCSDCDVINGVAICVECPQTTDMFGYMKSVYNNTCISCPYYCDACIPRTNAEILQYNHFFSMPELAHYSNKCFETFYLPDAHLYIDNAAHNIIQCPTDNSCTNTLNIALKLYCNSDDLTTDRIKSDNVDKFNKQNLFINDVLTQSGIPVIENYSLYNYLNQQAVRNGTISLILHQGTALSCLFPQSAIFTSFLRQSVFSLDQLSLVITGDTINTAVEFAGYTTIANFTSVTFTKLTILTSIRQGILSQSTLLITSYSELITVIFDNVVFLGESTNHQFSIILPYVSLFRLNNSIFLNVTLEQSDYLFTLQANTLHQPIAYQVNNVTIQNCIFSQLAIFLLDTDQSTVQYQAYFKNISILSTSFNNSQLITTKFTFGNSIGSITLDYWTLTNLTLYENSVLINTLGMEYAYINDINVYNSYLMDYSILIQSNIFNITNLNFKDSVIEYGNIIKSHYKVLSSDVAEINQLSLTINGVTVENVKYYGSKSFIYIDGTDFINMSFKLQNVYLIDNYLGGITKGVEKVQSVSYKQSNIYIEVDILNISNITIYRGYGYPEITMLNTDQLIVQDMKVSISTLYFSRCLHSKYSCVLGKAYVDKFYVMYIGQYTNIQLSGILFKSVICFNYPLIVLQSRSIMEQSIKETITITNSNFTQNLLLMTKSSKQSALIQVISQQELTLTFDNILFDNNHLNSYVQDLTVYSATTLLCESAQAQIIINNCTFLNNLATNTTDTVLFIKSDSLVINNSNFQGNNIITYSLIRNHIIWGFDEESVYADPILAYFPINSNGGSGYLVTGDLTILNTTITDSYSQNGGGFYLVAQGSGLINITQCQINYVHTSLVNTQSQGGFIYVDASKAKLTFIMDNCTIIDVWSRSNGGCVYIAPSLSYNSVTFNNLQITDCYSMLHSFLSVTFPKSTIITSILQLNNVSIITSEKSFKHYLYGISDLQEQEIVYLQNQNPLIYVKYGSISVADSNFYDNYAQGAIFADQCLNIYLTNIHISGQQVLYTPILKLQLMENYYGNLLLNNVEIKNVQQLQINLDSTQSLCLMFANYIIDEYTYSCPNVELVVPLNLVQSYDHDYSDCNMFQILANISYSFGIIQVPELSTSNNLVMQQVLLSNISCSRCPIGGFSIMNIGNWATISISQFYSISNNCGKFGCLLMSQNSLTNALYPNKTRRLWTDVKSSNQYSISSSMIIQHSKFIYNKAVYGAGLFGYNLSIVLQSTQFLNNNASYKGGGIYYDGVQTHNVFLVNSTINDNLAYEGGGIYLVNQTMQQTTKLDVIINNNKATHYGSQMTESPRSLTISVDKYNTLLNKALISQSTTEIIEQINVTAYKILGQSELVSYIRFPTGQSIGSYEYFDQYSQSYIPCNLTFRIIPLSQHLTQMKGLTNSKCTIQARRVQISKVKYDDFTSDYLSGSSVTFNDTSEDYNLDSFIIKFNPYLLDYVLQFQISCDSIRIPIYSDIAPYSITSEITDYKLRVNIQTFQCQMGEYYDITLSTCVRCDPLQSQYQVQVGANYCSYKNDVTTSEITSSMIQIKSAYWRPYLQSPTVEYCYHLEANCLGGWIPGDISCATGHIGALCEQCDLYNIRLEGSYSVSTSYTCGSCDSLIGNALTITMISIWTLVSILMSVSSTLETINQFILALRLRQFGVTVSANKSSSAILIKAFTNYLQIITTISTFQLDVPSSLGSVVDSVGNPIQSMAYSLDCFLVTISDVEIIYFRLVWGLLLAIIYIIVFLFLYSIGIAIGKLKYNLTIITTTLIYMYIYLQPNLVGGLISLLSYRNISNQQWVQGNVAYRYDTDQHYSWLLSFVLPLLLLIGVILPYVLWYGVYSNRFQLDNTANRKCWGYLYNEYKSNAYFWETIKILQKEFIIIVLAYYEDYIPIKASLCFIVLFMYNLLSNAYRPYFTGELNRIDIQSTSVCAVSIVLGSTIYAAQSNDFQEIIWPFYILIGVLNGLFITKIVLDIIYAYTDKLEQTIDTVRDKINAKWPTLKSRNSLFQRVLQNQAERKIIIRKRFQAIRGYLINQAKLILDFKRLNNLDMPQRRALTHILANSDSSRFHIRKGSILSQEIRSPDNLRDKHLSEKNARIYPINDDESNSHHE